MVMSVVRVAVMIRKNGSICMLCGGIVGAVVLVLIVVFVALLMSTIPTTIATTPPPPPPPPPPPSVPLRKEPVILEKRVARPSLTEILDSIKKLKKCDIVLAR